jgi:hypothetical protein
MHPAMHGFALIVRQSVTVCATATAAAGARFEALLGVPVVDRRAEPEVAMRLRQVLDA